MGQAQKGDPAPGYRAFISYSHVDDRFAQWLHRKLESHRRDQDHPLRPTFIDRAELVAGTDLSAQVRSALTLSDALIVVASPDARASRWVAQEIDLFRQLHPDRPVLTALIAGEPERAFPDALTHHQGQVVEPLAADFRDGHDGKRLGLLKLIAGLTGQPLDQLVQRDAQARHRRVMAVTAAALLLVLILSAALIAAVRARAEAERQRAEAEGLVEFMLTDLRDKLKGVGSPTVMAAVNQRALAYYSDQELETLDDGSLTRRARVLHAMGEDSERLGKFPEARRSYAEARRITQAVLSRNPRDPEAIFAHAQSEYWVGEAAWQQRSLDVTTQHWQGYADQAAALAKVEPGSKRVLLEQGFAQGNLCELVARRDADFARALPYCERSTAFMRQALTKFPADQKIIQALANRLGWESEVLAGLGRAEPALARRREEAAMMDRLIAAEPENSTYRERRLWPDIGTAKILHTAGRQNEAIAVLEDCIAKYDRLIAARPDDTFIVGQQMRAILLIAKVTGDPQWRARALQSYKILRASEPPEKLARYDKLLSELKKGTDNE